MLRGIVASLDGYSAASHAPARDPARRRRDRALRTPLVAVLGGGQLGRMLGLAGNPARARLPVPRPDLGRTRAIGRHAGRRRARRRAVAAQDGRGRRGRDLRVGGRPRAARRGCSKRAVTLSTRRPRPSRSRRTASTRRPCSASSGSRWRSSRTSTRSRTCTRRSSPSGSPPCLKTRRGRLRRQGPGGAARPGRGRRRLRGAARGRAAHPRSDGAVRPRALGARGPQHRRRRALLAAGREPARGRDPPRCHARRRPGSPTSCRRRPRVTPRALLEHFSYVGVLALELFQVGDTLLANEMAPRVHNSGHWTIEGAVTSQFENHLRAILGWPLGATDARRRERDGQLDRRPPRSGRGARDRGRAPAPLRQGAAPRPQGRPHHHHRRHRRPTSRAGSSALRAT